MKNFLLPSLGLWFPGCEVFDEEVRRRILRPITQLKEALAEGFKTEVQTRLVASVSKMIRSRGKFKYRESQEAVNQ